MVGAGLALKGCSFLIYLEGWEVFLEVSGADSAFLSLWAC